MMLLARKRSGASIAVANVLWLKDTQQYPAGCGSIRSNVSWRLLYQHRSEPNSAIPDDLGDYGHYPRTNTDVLEKEIGLKVGIMLAALYIISIFIMFLMPHDLALH